MIPTTKTRRTLKILSAELMPQFEYCCSCCSYITIQYGHFCLSVDYDGQLPNTNAPKMIYARWRPATVQRGSSK